MKLRIALLSALLVACGSLGDPANPRLDDPTPPYQLQRDASSDEQQDASVLKDAADVAVDVIDAGTDAQDASSTDAANVEASVDATCSSAPSIGHCLTHMATLCYETSFDDSEACAKTDQSSGWHTGPCDLLRFDGSLRANGGCIIDCQLSYSYPLGGGPSTEQTRIYAKVNCEENGGTFVDVTTSVDAGSDSGTN